MRSTEPSTIVLEPLPIVSWIENLRLYDVEERSQNKLICTIYNGTLTCCENEDAVQIKVRERDYNLYPGLPFLYRSHCRFGIFIMHCINKDLEACFEVSEILIS